MENKLGGKCLATMKKYLTFDVVFSNTISIDQKTCIYRLVCNVQSCDKDNLN